MRKRSIKREPYRTKPRPAPAENHPFPVQISYPEGVRHLVVWSAYFCRGELYLLTASEGGDPKKEGQLYRVVSDGIAEVSDRMTYYFSHPAALTANARSRLLEAYVNKKLPSRSGEIQKAPFDEARRKVGGKPLNLVSFPPRYEEVGSSREV